MTSRTPADPPARNPPPASSRGAHRPGSVSGPSLDATDRALLDRLRSDGRASYAELARLVGLSAPSVQDRVRRLEERGVIVGYRALVPPDAVGLSTAALVEIVQSDAADQEDVARRLREIDEVEDCWAVAGDESFIVKLRVPDVAALERSLARLRSVRGIARTRTTVVLSTRWEGRPQDLPAMPAVPAPRPDVR